MDQQSRQGESPGDGEELFWKLAEELTRTYPGFRIIDKGRSPLMRLLYQVSLAFLWCPDFLDSYTTVLVSRVYMPAHLIGTLDGYKVLRHEAVHIRDCFRTGVLPFVVTYLFVLPVGITLRAYWEYRGYLETMRVEWELTGTIAPDTVDWIADRFTGPDYLWMCPCHRFITKKLERARRRILTSPGTAKASHQPSKPHRD